MGWGNVIGGDTGAFAETTGVVEQQGADAATDGEEFLSGSSDSLVDFEDIWSVVESRIEALRNAAAESMNVGINQFDNTEFHGQAWEAFRERNSELANQLQSNMDALDDEKERLKTDLSSWMTRFNDDAEAVRNTMNAVNEQRVNQATTMTRFREGMEELDGAGWGNGL